METYSPEARLQDVTVLQREQLNDTTDIAGAISHAICVLLPPSRSTCAFVRWLGDSRASSSFSPAHGCIILHLQRSQKVKGGKNTQKSCRGEPPPLPPAYQCLTTARWSQSSSLIDPQTASSSLTAKQP